VHIRHVLVARISADTDNARSEQDAVGVALQDPASLTEDPDSGWNVIRSRLQQRIAANSVDACPATAVPQHAIPAGSKAEDAGSRARAPEAHEPRRISARIPDDAGSSLATFPEDAAAPDRTANPHDSRPAALAGVLGAPSNPHDAVERRRRPKLAFFVLGILGDLDEEYDGAAELGSKPVDLEGTDIDRTELVLGPYGRLVVGSVDPAGNKILIAFC
jgi:hypothetical protein